MNPNWEISDYFAVVANKINTIEPQHLINPITANRMPTTINKVDPPVDISSTLSAGLFGL